MSSNDNIDEKVVLFERDLERLGITQGSDALRELERKGLFPPRRRLGIRQICWLRSEVMEHLINLPRAQDKPVPGRIQAAKTLAATAATGRHIGRPTKAMVAAREAKTKTAANNKGKTEDEAAAGGGS